MKNLKRHLSVANVLSCVALFVALSGAAYAVSPIGKKAVKTQNLGNGAVTALKLRNGAVTTPKLRNLAVTGSKLGEASVGSTKLASGAVRAAALGGGVVTTAKLNNGAVTNSKLGADAVTTGKLQDGAVTAAKLAPSFLSQLVKGVSYVTALSPSNTTEATKTITASCPAGKQAIAGGAKVVGTPVVLVAIAESGPTPVNAEGKRTGWIAVAREETGGDVPWSVEAYAVCAEL